MPFKIPLSDAAAAYPEYTFVKELTPSEQKAAFHVRNADGENLCLKIIAPDYCIDRLNREIQALQSIAHPNVVSLKEYTFSSKLGQQRHYMVEEFVEGHDLSEYLKPGNVWRQEKNTCSFFAQLCDGLNELKDKSIVHRDLKPSNIRVRSNGAPVIIDFGLARHLGLPDLTRTSDGAAIGTPTYFAPEQCSGNKYDIDHRTDLFALGIMLYQALTGGHPFYRQGMTLQDLSDNICNYHDHVTTQEFSALPQNWQLIVKRLLEKERAKRPLDAGQVAKILRKIGGI